MENSPVQQRVWKHRTGALVLGNKTLLMGIVNVTPDSFSDGGQFFDPVRAAQHALCLQDEGADLVDIGAESTRPGSDPVQVGEQLRRLLPIFDLLKGKLEVPISVDTCLCDVAAECLASGASIVNDISGFHRDPTLAKTCADFGAGVVLMHCFGAPKTMQSEAHYTNLISQIHKYLEQSLVHAHDSGIGKDHILVDPGIGFGKTFEENYRLLENLSRFAELAAGIVVGPSRKAFTGEFNKLPASQRQFSTAAAVAIAVLHGADVLRVHDVKEMKQVTDILDRFRELQREESC
jgi:dihydropteroate synthase